MPISLNYYYASVIKDQWSITKWPLNDRNYHHSSVLEQFGSGQFGQVSKALWSIAGATKDLAIKTLRAELPEEEKVRFLQEAAIIGQFSHPNVVKLYGVVTVEELVNNNSTYFVFFTGDYICSSASNISR